MISPLQKIQSKNNSRSLREEDLPKLHDLFMKEYGWIPIQEFSKLPLSTFWVLYNTISERKKMEKEEHDKQQKKSKSKR